MLIIVPVIGHEVNYWVVLVRLMLWSMFEVILKILTTGKRLVILAGHTMICFPILNVWKIGNMATTNIGVVEDH